MKLKQLTILFVMLMLFSAFKSDKPSYLIYNQKGKTVKYKKMVDDLAEADVIFFGELHNNAIAHWLQLELTRSCFETFEGKLVLGAEMFEADNQLLLDEYLSDQIRQKDFEKEARLWPNYQTDYKPLLEMAHDSGLHFVATNIPRRYAALVNKKGFEGLETLTDEAKKYIAPLPIDFDASLPGYAKMAKMMGGMGHGMKANNIVKAQAIKDATMAHFIAQNLKTGHQFIHYNGAFHSNNYEGIVWYLKKLKPELKIRTISTVEQKDIEKLDEENQTLADFTIVVDEDVTKTY